MDHDIRKVMVKKASHFTNEDSAAKWRLNALVWHHDILKLMIKQAAPCVDEDSAAKLRLDTQIQKERNHSERLYKKMFLYVDQTGRLYLLPPTAK